MRITKTFKIVITLLFISSSGVAWPAAMDTPALEKEVKDLNSRILELEFLKARLAELEKKLADVRLASYSSTTHDAEDKPEINFTGAFRFNYAYKDYQRSNKDKGGDFIFDHFRLGLDVLYKDLILSTQYRWFGYMHIIHHAYMGYNFTDVVQGQIGLMKVPFGILPYADHSYWLGAHYYIGLSDEYDLGLKFIVDLAPWDVQVAFFKNADWGDPADKERYSTDVVTDLSLSQANEETNQGNLRIARTFRHNHDSSTEIGISGMVGQLYNSLTKNMGNRWAAAAHINGYYGPWNVMLEGAWYDFNPENPPGVDGRTVLLANYGSSYPLASEGTMFTANVSYDVPVAWGPINKLTFFNDYNLLFKKEKGFSNTQMYTPGILVTSGPMLVYFEAIIGKNMIFIGNEKEPLGRGNPNANWNIRYNISIGYYF